MVNAVYFRAFNTGKAPDLLSARLLYGVGQSQELCDINRLYGSSRRYAEVLATGKNIFPVARAPHSMPQPR
jgi:hypothetical protein